MIDIDKIFDIDKISSKKGINKSISLNNPIIYVFVGGDGTNILKTICDFNEEKELNSIGGIEYINIGTEFCDYTNNNNILINKSEEENFIKKRKNIYDDFDRYDDILKMISYIELKFLEHSYSMPIRRRVHFIVEGYNEYSCVIKKVIDIVEKFFLSRNLAPIIDVFALINDKPDSTDIQNASTYALLQELKEIEDNVNMIYIVSNLNSVRKISKPEELYTSIARTAIIKEFDYKEQPYDFSYNDGRIIENVKNVPQEKRGIFYSLGLKVIERPKSILQFVALNTVIARNDFVNEDIINEGASNILNEFLEMINRICKNPLDNTSFMENQHMYGIILNIKATYDNCDTNIDIIRDFFGNNIDKYFEYNSQHDLHSYENESINYINNCFEKYITDISIGYFTGVDILKKLETQLKEIKDNLSNTVYEAQIKLDNWKSQQFLYKKKLFDDKYKPAFDIANDYIMCLYKVFVPSIALNICKSFESKIKNLIDNADLLNEEFISSQKKLIEMAEAKLSEEKGEIIKNNFINYYSNAIKKYIENNYVVYFENVYSKIFSLTRKDTNSFYLECIKYIDKFILETPEFNLNVYDEISNRLLNSANGEYNEYIVNDLFNKEITDDKFYFIKLVNEKNFYSNICVLTDNNSIIKKISNSDINYIVYSGDAKLEILYFIGAFNDDSLAYANIYKDAYNNLTQ